MSIRIRNALATDADGVIALSDEFTRYLHDLGDIADYKLTADIYRRDGFGSSPAFFGLVAETDSEVIGYMLYHFGYDAELAARIMFVIDLYVADGHRKQGAGASLMARAKSISRECEAIEIVWSVYKFNQEAHKFYERMGAKLIDDLDYMQLTVDDKKAR